MGDRPIVGAQRLDRRRELHQPRFRVTEKARQHGDADSAGRRGDHQVGTHQPGHRRAAPHLLLQPAHRHVVLLLLDEAEPRQRRDIAAGQRQGTAVRETRRAVDRAAQRPDPPGHAVAG